MKKNIIIIILSILVLGMGGYLVYDKIIDKEEITSKEEKVEQNKTTTENDNVQEEMFNADLTLQEIKEVKLDNTLNDVQKMEQISKLVDKDYYDILGVEPKYTCNLDTFECSSTFELNGEKIVGSSITFEKDLNSISLYGPYGWYYVNITEEPSENASDLSNYFNYLQYLSYEFKLKVKLGLDLNSGLYDESIYKKYSLNDSNVCIGYTNTENYFYININEVNTPRPGWYYFDYFTGECSNLVREAAQYKIDKKTYNYELIEK